MWNKVTEKEIPNTETAIITYDKDFGENIEIAFVARQHVLEDVKTLGYSRITHWKYDNDKSKDKSDEEEPVSSWFKEYGEKRKENKEEDPVKIQDWVSENGKWRIKFNENITSGTLVECKSGRSYIWKYKNANELSFVGIRDVPKYVKNTIKSCVSNYKKGIK